MPPKAKVGKEDIVSAALQVVRRSGASGLNARAVAAELGVSTQPIFYHYKTMEELKLDVITAADGLYQSYLQEDMKAGKYPPYKASGMAYIRFAKEERELFKLLFMRDRSGELVTEDRESIRPILEVIQEKTGFTEQEAYQFHLEMWVYVHGIATMIATAYLALDEPFISGLLTDAFTGLLLYWRERGKDDGSH